MELYWSEPALESLQAIKNFISIDSKYYSKVFIEDIIHHTEQLKDYPNIGRIVPEYNQDDIREIIFGNYRIIYHSGRKRIVILNIIHASRDFINTMNQK